MRRNRPLPTLALLTLIMVSTLAVNADAHLMILRQGAESSDIPNSFDKYGEAVAVGDFDNDGFGDVVCAAPDEDLDIGAPARHGAATVNYGTPTGPTHLGDGWITVGAIGDQDARFGHALAVGRFNGDDYDDLAVGVPLLDDQGGSIPEYGAVFIYYGSASGLGTVPDIFHAQLTGSTYVPFKQYGSSLAAGDFDGDGFDDLAIGAQGDINAFGEVYFLRGSATGMVYAGDPVLTLADFGYTATFEDRFGFSLCIAEMNDDAFEDIAIGAPYMDIPGAVDGGRVFLIAGSGAGPDTSNTRMWTADVHTNPIDNDLYGLALAAGAVYSDTTHAALAIGAPGRSSWQGWVFLIENPFGGQFFSNGDIMRQNTGGASTTEDGAQFGRALAVGEVTGDNLEDLIVGAPYDDSTQLQGFVNSVGEVVVFPGAANAGAGNGAFILNAQILNDIETGTFDRLGWALAVGSTDGDPRGSIVIGAPGKDYPAYTTAQNVIPEAGQVYVYAPWRQPSGRASRSAAVENCFGGLVYSHRPFQQLPIASTTKAMTVLLALEAIQEGKIDSTAVYTVPAWVANNVTGSQAGLVTGEQIQIRDLIRLTMAMSGNDAAYSLGDTLSGGGHTWTTLDSTLLGFANRMNIKAMDLGMNATVFTNPAGRPVGNHWSTAQDMAKLARACMENTLYQNLLAGPLNWSFVRDLPGSSNDTLWTYSYGWLQGVQSAFPGATGVKPGWNPPSISTGIATTSPSDIVAVGCFGFPQSFSSANTMRDLLQVGAVLCSVQVPPPPDDPPPGRTGGIDTIPTDSDSTSRGLLLEIPQDLCGNLLVELYRKDFDVDVVNVRLHVARQTEVFLDAGDTWSTGWDPFSTHDGMTLCNTDSVDARFTLTLSHPISVQTLVLAPGACHVIPPYSGPPDGRKFEMTLTTARGETATLDVQEHGYAVPVALGTGPNGPGVFQGTLCRSACASNETVRIVVTGADLPGQGGCVTLVVRAPEADAGVVGIGDPGFEPRTTLFTRAFPNPFRGSTRIEFSLETSSPVGLGIFDAQGRLVRRLLDGALLPAGRHEAVWNGRDDNGRTASAGMYFYRIAAKEGAGTGRVVRR